MKTLKTEQLATFLGIPTPKLENTYYQFQSLFVAEDYVLTAEKEICWTQEGAQSLAALSESVDEMGKYKPWIRRLYALLNSIEEREEANNE